MEKQTNHLQFQLHLKKLTGFDRWFVVLEVLGKKSDYRPDKSMVLKQQLSATIIEEFLWNIHYLT